MALPHTSGDLFPATSVFRLARIVPAFCEAGTTNQGAPRLCKNKSPWFVKGPKRARALRERIPPSYRCRATYSDFWLAYAEVFPARTHRCTGKGEGETCHVERFSNTLRQRLGRLVRKTLFFSKCDRMHEVALCLFIHHYN